MRDRRYDYTEARVDLRCKGCGADVTLTVAHWPDGPPVWPLCRSCYREAEIRATQRLEREHRAMMPSCPCGGVLIPDLNDGNRVKCARCGTFVIPPQPKAGK